MLGFIKQTILENKQNRIKRKYPGVNIVLHPDTSGMYWLELHRAVEFAARGEAEARSNLDKIWKVIYE